MNADGAEAEAPMPATAKASSVPTVVQAAAGP